MAAHDPVESVPTMAWNTHLRAGEGPNQSIPVLAFTAEAEEFSTHLVDGFDGLVAKPMIPAHAVAAIHAAIVGDFEEASRVAV